MRMHTLCICTIAVHYAVSATLLRKRSYCTEFGLLSLTDINKKLLLKSIILDIRTPF